MKEKIKVEVMTTSDFPDSLYAVKSICERFNREQSEFEFVDCGYINFFNEVEWKKWHDDCYEKRGATYLISLHFDCMDTPLLSNRISGRCEKVYSISSIMEYLKGDGLSYF